jgi:predicted amidohydrolase YtcJ
MKRFAAASSVVSLTLGLSALSPARAMQPAADAIYSGGPIITMNDTAPRPEAIAVKDGKIIAVGAASDVAKHRGPQTASVDLAGKSLLPGFIDGHGHVFATGIQAVSANLLAPPTARATPSRRSRTCCASTPRARWPRSST